MSIGSNLKHYRKMCGFNQKELGSRIGVSDRTISSWEIDRTEPNMECIDKLCNVLSCTRNELISGHDDIPKMADDVMELIDLYNRATPEQRKAVIALLRSFSV